MPTQRCSSSLLSTDQRSSVIRVISATSADAIAYTPFGFNASSRNDSLLGFNGALLERLTRGYLLGNGYRTYSAKLQRFSAPDNLSPFDKGGINSYVYCSADPIDFVDPSGHAGNFWKGLLNIFGRRRKSPKGVAKMDRITGLTKSAGDLSSVPTKQPLSTRSLTNLSDTSPSNAFNPSTISATNPKIRVPDRTRNPARSQPTQSISSGSDSDVYDLESQMIAGNRGAKAKKNIVVMAELNRRNHNKHEGLNNYIRDQQIKKSRYS